MTIERAQHSSLRYSAEIGTLFIYIYSLYLSRLLIGTPSGGGSLYMCGRLALLLITGPISDRRQLNRTVRIIIYSVSGLLLVVNLLMLAFNPPAAPKQLWLMFGVILTLLLNEALGKRMLTRTGVDARLRYWVLVLTLTLAGVLALALTAEGQLPRLLLLYLLSMGICTYSQLKHGEVLRALPLPGAEAAAAMRSMLAGNNAYAVYRTMSGLILMAMSFTLAMLYTFVALTAERMTVSMAIAFVSLILVRELADLLTSLRSRRKPVDPINQITLGLILWLYGLLVAAHILRTNPGDRPAFYAAIAVCTLGVFLCLNCLGRMEQVTEQLACFSNGERPVGLNRLRAADWEQATVLGQLAALTALTLLLLLMGEKQKIDFLWLQRRFRPLMIIPALVMVLAALLASYRWPFTQRYINKLRRVVSLRAEGEDNPTLSRQVETVVTGKRRRPIGTHIIMAVLRPFMLHTLQGTENLRREDDSPLVFLCNHGEFYGPVAGIIFIPEDVRPWTISEIVNDPEEMAAYFYKYTISPIRWLPSRLKMPLCRRVAGPLSVWVMNQLEAIPVYRNKPTLLMKTMRLSVEALIAGDNILIFPENPNALGEEHGYEHEGVGELFSGFAMLAQIYYNKTGRCLHFVPMFSHKKRRTMTFGPQIVYDPDNEAEAERERISCEAHRTMCKIYEAEQAAYEADPRPARRPRRFRRAGKKTE